MKIAGNRHWDIGSAGLEFAFSPFSVSAAWDGHNTDFILSLLAVKCGSYSIETLLVHHERLYSCLFEEDMEVPLDVRGRVGIQCIKLMGK